MNRTLSITSLMLSIAALAVAMFAWIRPPSANPIPAQIRALVDADLQRRETELVKAWAPKFQAIYKDMLGENEKLDERALHPQSLADLLRPLVTIIEKMQGGDEPPKK